MIDAPERDLPVAGLPIRMVRPHLDDIPQWSFHSGYAMRAMKHDEATLWEALWCVAEPYEHIQPGLFASQFGENPTNIESSCFFLTGMNGEVAGTISAWQAALPDGQVCGQIHWVAVHPEHQGQGLSKPLMTHAMNLLSTRHDHCFLETATRRLSAIKVYLDFGFLPDMTFPDAARAWRLVRTQLDHPALALA